MDIRVDVLFMRFILIIFIFLLSITVLVDVGTCKPSYVTIVLDNKPNAVIVIPERSTDQLQSTVQLLSSYINTSTGVQLYIISESEAEKYKNKVRIWVGQSRYVVKQKIDITKLDTDGFIFAFPDQRNIVIIGPTDWGTEFGIYEFLERFIGVRWLIPGPNGEYIPKHHSVRVQITGVRQEPVFFSRLLSGFPGEIQKTWARRNRMHGRIEFHSNLLNIFPPEKYTKTNPEFFPMWNGKRYLPPNNNVEGWQPCFAAPGIVDEAIKNICGYFDKHPTATSYSLGINDGSGFCECEKCTRISSKKNFLNLTDYSKQYYNWANKVVEGVLKKYPDKWFGCLAYSEVAAPPTSLKVNPRIVPFMTYDRMKWIDPAIEAEGKKLTDQWHRLSHVVGWYDYIYGTPYLVPRVYFHEMTDYYRYGYKNGVRVMYAEAYPNWGEGPKLYVALKLQWNPNQNVDALLEEWYVAAVGKKAASDLESYYKLWERFWTKRVLNSKWFSLDGGQYLLFFEPGYLDYVSYEDIEKSRQLLESVVAKTETADQRARSNLILRAFEYYEASAISYLGLVKNITQPGKDRKYYEDFKQKRLGLVNEFENDSVLIHPRRFDKIGNLKF